MSDFLQQMMVTSKARAAVAAQSFVSSDFDKPVFPLNLSGFDLIAEIKNRSPAEGELALATDNRVKRALAYARGGAAAISVLTEPERFDGALEHLEEVATAVNEHQTPVMRKDFLLDVVQVLEARAAGASGLLLIAAMLSNDELRNLLDCAFEHDLFVLLESFDMQDFERSVKLLDTAAYRRQGENSKLLFGVNTRDLRTLAVDPDRLQRFSESLPQGVICVAESGQQSADDAADVAGLGYRAVLVGTALMRASNEEDLIRAMLVAGREAVR